MLGQGDDAGGLEGMAVGSDMGTGVDVAAAVGEGFAGGDVDGASKYPLATDFSISTVCLVLLWGC